MENGILLGIFALLSLCASLAYGSDDLDAVIDDVDDSRYSVWYHRLKRSAEGNASGEEPSSNTSHGSGHAVRYHVASINWRRVENPIIVCLWILFAGLAKIGFRTRYMHKIVSRVPESCLLICLGLIVGGIAYAINKDHQLDKLLFNPDTFFLFILPPIVLEAGYFMPKEPFFDNLGTILTYAIVGTLFNAFAIGLSLFGVYSLGWMPGMGSINVLQCLLFGSIISAVDPVAVISVFEEIHVNIVLYICVFGESLLNDGVAVVLYHIFEQYIEMDEIIAIDYVAAVASFFVVILGGLSIGIFFGYFGSFLTKYTLNNRVIEPTCVFVTCYLAYLTAEIFHLSGIIAIVFAGFVMSSYVEHNISQKSHTTVKYGMKMLANMCETIIFMLLGIAAVSDFWQHWNTGFVLWTLFFITAYRAIAVVGLTWILNKIRLERINGVDQFVMAYGGLRGAIAFSLASLTSPNVVPTIKTMICACIACILFTSFVQGSTIRPFVEYLHVEKETKHQKTMFEDLNMRLIDHLMTGIEDCIGHRGHHYWMHRLTKFNTDNLMRWFIREPYKTHDQVLLDTFRRINKREAQDMLLEMERGGSYNELASEKTLASLLLPAGMRRTSSTASFCSLMRNASDACIDMRGIEMARPSANIREDESLGDAHHMLKENMYQTRVKTDTRYKRGEIDTSHTQKRQEQEILIRRRVHQKRRKSQKNKKHRHHLRNPLPGRTKHGSFTTVPNEGRPSNKHQHSDPVCVLEQTINPLTGIVAPSVLIENPSQEGSIASVKEEPEDEGIMFTVHQKLDEPDSKARVDDEDQKEEEPVALEKELPWRTATPSVPVFDPRERSGSLHPHFYEDSDSDDDQPGTSHNLINNNANSHDSDRLLPPGVAATSAAKTDKRSSESEEDQTIPLLAKPEDAAKIDAERFSGLAEDTV